jgi:ankyrin repeat protein
VCHLLLSKGANPSTLDFEGYTPLHWAVENNSPDVVDVLLASGADQTIRNGSGQTANDMVRSLAWARWLRHACLLLRPPAPSCFDFQVAGLKPKHQEPMYVLLRAAAAKQAAAKEQSTLAATIGASSPGGPRR